MGHYLFRNLVILSLVFFPALSFSSQNEPAYLEEILNEDVEEGLNLSSLITNQIPLNQFEARNTGYSYSREDKVHSYSHKKKGDAVSRGSWAPNFEASNQVESPSSIFFRADIGLGLLYFSGLRGNLAGVPAFLYLSQTTNAPIKSRLSYNRTPVFEYILGYRFLSYFKTALSYLHQSNVTVQTKLIQAGAPPSSSGNANFDQLTSNLSLDAILVKFYLESPWPLFWRNVMTNFYLGTGVGMGWQSWTSNKINRVTVLTNYLGKAQPIRQKISTSVAWSFDSGFRIQQASVDSNFSVLAGCKFNLWGQARNLGKLSQQGGYKYGLFKPFSVKMIYQWAPYLGVQWNFPTNVESTCKWRFDESYNPLAAQVNVGVGMLYFKTVRGNLVARPNRNGNSNGGWQTARLNSDSLTYNRTPLFEYLVQHQFNQYFQLGVSFQNQANISVQTNGIPTESSNSFIADYALLVSNLNLDALMVKGYGRFPLFNREARYNLSPYFGFGFGPGWQTWNSTASTLIGSSNPAALGISGLQGGYLPLKQKISTNFVFNLDFGAQLSHRNAESFLSILAGCKYNFWGQARNIGKLQQQSSLRIGLNAPFIIKNIYQWAPYMGVQWNFPNLYVSKKPYFLDGKNPRTWKPYWVNILTIQKPQSLFTQFNVGIGLLYFNRMRGNLTVVPRISNRNITLNSPVKGRLTYNRTPLYDYQIGFRLNSSLKVAVSYQHQGNVTVSTKFLSNPPPGASTFLSQKVQFASDLVLDGILLKVYYEFPKGMVWRNLVSSPYFALGMGPAWQTWKRTTINQTVTQTNFFNEFEVSLRQKISTNVAFMWDFGVRMQSPYPDSGFSTTLGLKFNLWGQAREMGKMSSQLNPKYGLWDPVKIASIYQWAPYLGVQWNF
jgi:hypothetical protein